MKRLRYWYAFCGLVALTGCGGGGGSGSATPLPAAAPTPNTEVAISGRVTFDSIPVVSSGMGLPRLDYASIEARPVRGVTLQVVDAQTNAIVATATTSEDGSYSASVPVDTEVILRARAEMLRSGVPGWNYRVVDNVQSDALFVLDGAQFNSGTVDLIRDLHAGSGWTGAAYSEPRSAAPFAILDTVVEGTDFMLAVDPNLVFPPLTLHWSPDNQATPGATGLPDTESGEIGGTFYSAALGGIYLLGEENADTEEYDPGIILHEWAHFIEDAYFRTDSIGGPHTLADRLDMRVAFGEGFASALAGMVLGDGLLLDTFGPGQSAGFRIDVENVTGLNRGWYSEESVQAILFDLFDTVQDTPQDSLAIGFAPIFEVLADRQRNSIALTSLFPFIQGLKIALAAEATEIDAMVATQGIATISDDYGSGRTNPPAPDDIDVLPIYTDIVVNGGPVSDICSSDAFGASLINIESVNKLGSRRFLRFTATASADHTFTATATLIPIGMVSDPDMELHQRGPLLPFPLVDPPGKSAEVNLESFSWPLVPGDYVLEVYEWTNTNARDDPDFPPIGRTCFDVEITTP